MENPGEWYGENGREAPARVMDVFGRRRKTTISRFLISKPGGIVEDIWSGVLSGMESGYAERT